MKEKGIVIKKEGNKALIQTVPGKECKDCRSCGASGPRQFTIYGENALKLQEGDKVEIEIDSSSMMKVFCFLYGIPLVAFVASIVAYYHLTQNPVTSFIAAISATVVSYILIVRYLRGKEQYAPKITKK